MDANHGCKQPTGFLRSYGEVRAGHIPGARNLEWKDTIGWVAFGTNRGLSTAYALIRVSDTLYSRYRYTYSRYRYPYSRYRYPLFALSIPLFASSIPVFCVIATLFCIIGTLIPITPVEVSCVPWWALASSLDATGGTQTSTSTSTTFPTLLATVA
jgi:hypothetical protein